MAQISREIKQSAGVREQSQQQSSDGLTKEEFELVQLALDLCSQKAVQPVTDIKTSVQNVLQLNQKLNLLGKGFDEQTALVLQKHITEFADKRRGYFLQINFFGRIQYQNGSYFVLECLPAKARKTMYRFAGEAPRSAIPDDFKRHRLQKQFVPEEKLQFLSAKKQKKLKDYLEKVMDKLDPENLQFDLSTMPPRPKCLQQTVYPRGDNVHPQGVNRFIYFVTSNICTTQAQWTRLPDAEARQIRLSRFVQTGLSGDLTRRIYDKIPPFPGVEAHYLRCLIARIKHGAQLVPSQCLKLEDPPEENEEELNEEQQKFEAHDKLQDAKLQEDFDKDDVEPEALREKILKKHYLVWPSVNKEMDDIEFEGLLKADGWVHACPVISHRGVVLPFELPEEVEPEADADDEADGDEEEEVDADKKEVGEDAEEKEPAPPTVQERLDTMFKECDQKRLLDENAVAVKEAAKLKCEYKLPKAHWELVRDQWDAPRKENKGIYVSDRFFGIEQQPIDINCKQQELPEKEQKYWDKETEKEEALKAAEEAYLEGDQYDEEKEILNGERPEVMGPANNDAEIIVHNVKPSEISVAAEQVKIPAYKTVFDKLLSKNSPVIVESNRWKGMLNVCYAYNPGETVTYASIYIGDGFQVQQHNAFDKIRRCLPPAFAAVPADILEELDPPAEIEKEVQERVIDMERKDQLKAEKKRLEEEEKKRQEEAQLVEEGEKGEEGAEKEGEEKDPEKDPE